MGSDGLNHSEPKRMILIDDDPIYCAIMRKVAATKNICLDIFPSMMDVEDSAREVRGAYVAAIVDYDLGPVNGIEIISYLGSLLGDIPIILASSNDRSDALKNARCQISKFVNKAAGYSTLLEEANTASEIERLVMY
jgi:DNA-binding NtrC family response regulator